jgi:hypothetical protein
VKNSRSDPAAAKISGARSLRAGFVQSWIDFWFAPVHPVGLHALRFLSAILFLFWLVMLAGHQEAFFGWGGWVDRQVYNSSIRAAEGAVSQTDWSLWSLLYLFGSNSVWVNLIYWTAMVVFVLFGLGLWTRVTSVLTWVFVVSFQANPITRQDADPLLAILAFYLMIGYVLLGQRNQQLSWTDGILGTKQTWLFGRGEQPASIAANLAIRLLQVHFALVVVVSALHKLQSGDWWSGVAFWYPLHPPFQTTMDSLRAEATHAQSTLFFLSLEQYLVLAWQLGFPCFAWRRAWRPVLLGGALVGWIGCLAIYKQPLFGPVYCIAALSYLTPAEWLGICDKLKLATDRILGRKAAPSPSPVKQGSRA